MNENVDLLEYAFFGPLVVRAGEIEKELKQGIKKPFKELLKVYLGDCHAMGQQPITFIRQVLATVSMPSLLDDPKVPEDAKERARMLLNECRGSSNVLKLVKVDRNGKRSGVLAPVPQYPLYLAALTEFDMPQISYYLDESKNWAISIEELERAVEEARNFCQPKAIVVINPGNPTGQVLTRENIEDIIRFAHKEKLFILADEVYQQNIYTPHREFCSFKKVMTEMGLPYKDMKLASFMSISKGYTGECGLRGGYAEAINLTPEERKMLYISVCSQLCPTTLGQVVTACIVNPPKPGEPSYDLFLKEKEKILSELKKRAKIVAEELNGIPGMSCNEIQGALYAFPKIHMPQKAVEAAKKEGRTPDEFYALQLLENTGICCTPGTGFEQLPGTHHIRITILPQTDESKEMLETLKKFHRNFLEKYS